MLDLDIMEPVTIENVNELQPGEWIWDNKKINRRAHKIVPNCGETVIEPIGFRQINALALHHFPRWDSKPFLLSNFDSSYGGYTWSQFEAGRYYKFKKKEIS